MSRCIIEDKDSHTERIARLGEIKLQQSSVNGNEEKNLNMHKMIIQSITFGQNIHDVRRRCFPSIKNYY